MKLSDYIKGLRKGKEAHQFEKESMKDPFLADAMDGYQQVDGDHTRRLRQLHRQVAARASGRRHRGIVSWSVAACLVLGIGISSYFLFMKGEDVMPHVAFEEEMLPSTVRLHEAELAKSSNPPGTSDTPGTSALSAPSVSKSKKISSDVLAHTKHVQPTPTAIPADTGKNILIAMKEDSQALSEIAVVGDDRIPKPLISKSEYNKYLKENLIRPSDETCKDIKGTVTLSFYVDKNGNPERITVVKGLCKSADQEAVRLVKEGPKWTLGNPPVELKIKF